MTAPQLDWGHKGEGWGVLVGMGTSVLGNGATLQGYLLLQNLLMYRNNEAK
jgi:hypothetical protein